MNEILTRGHSIEVNLSSEGVGHLQLAKPEKLNAMDEDMVGSIIEAGAVLHARQDLRSVVISGQGNAFCAGIDKAVFMGEAPPKTDLLTRTHGDCNPFQHVVMQFRRLNVPVIAAIHGVCFGAGLALASGADIRIATHDARFAIREIHWGLIPDMAAFVAWKNLVRDDHLRSLVYTGREVAGTEAMTLGLVTQLATDPLNAAITMAESIAGRNPDAIGCCKRLFEFSRDASTADILLRESEGQKDIMGSANQIEAVASQIQKRKPKYR